MPILQGDVTDAFLFPKLLLCIFLKSKEGTQLTFDGRFSRRLALWFNGWSGLFSLEVFIFELITWDIYDSPDPELGFKWSLLIEKFKDSTLEFNDFIDSLDIFLLLSVPIEDKGAWECFILTWLGLRSWTDSSGGIVTKLLCLKFWFSTSVMLSAPQESSRFEFL
jgi:hypothetical protein